MPSEVGQLNLLLKKLVEIQAREASGQSTKLQIAEAIAIVKTTILGIDEPVAVNIKEPKNNFHIGTRENFSHRLKRIRKENDITRQDLGIICGVSAGQICKYEQGESIPTDRTIKRIAKGIGVTPAQLVKGTNFEHRFA